jgi:aminoglycoside phosphotransferase (APT) family kinase protein
VNDGVDGRTAPVAPPGLDLPRLDRHLQASVIAHRLGPLRSAVLMTGGRSNLTYELSDGRHTLVLRRQPLGHVLPTAHDMEREYRVLSALAQTDVPVPRPLLFCGDRSVVGSPFYVMERVDGDILRTPEDSSKLTPEQADACSRLMMEGLVAIHQVNPVRCGLGGLGHPAGYMARQLRRWSDQWRLAKTRDIDGVDVLFGRLAGVVPQSTRGTLVHGDLRIDNAVLGLGRQTSMRALLDWEMATLGDPLADLAMLMMYWSPSDAPPVIEVQRVTAHPGFWSAERLAEEYAAQSGNPLHDMDVYVVFAHLKLAIIAETVHARYLAGETVGEGFEAIGATVPLLVDRAREIAGSSRLSALRA